MKIWAIHPAISVLLTIILPIVVFGMDLSANGCCGSPGGGLETEWMYKGLIPIVLAASWTSTVFAYLKPKLTTAGVIGTALYLAVFATSVIFLYYLSPDYYVRHSSGLMSIIEGAGIWGTLIIFWVVMLLPAIGLLKILNQSRVSPKKGKKSLKNKHPMK